MAGLLPFAPPANAPARRVGVGPDAPTGGRGPSLSAAAVGGGGGGGSGRHGAALRRAGAGSRGGRVRAAGSSVTANVTATGHSATGRGGPTPGHSAQARRAMASVLGGAYAAPAPAPASSHFGRNRPPQHQGHGTGADDSEEALMDDFNAAFAARLLASVDSQVERLEDETEEHRAAVAEAHRDKQAVAEGLAREQRRAATLEAALRRESEAAAKAEAQAKVEARRVHRTAVSLNAALEDNERLSHEVGRTRDAAAAAARELALTRQAAAAAMAQGRVAHRLAERAGQDAAVAAQGREEAVAKAKAAAKAIAASATEVTALKGEVEARHGEVAVARRELAKVTQDLNVATAGKAVMAQQWQGALQAMARRDEVVNEMQAQRDDALAAARTSVAAQQAALRHAEAQEARAAAHAAEAERKMALLADAETEAQGVGRRAEAAEAEVRALNRAAAHQERVLLEADTVIATGIKRGERQARQLQGVTARLRDEESKAAALVDAAHTAEATAEGAVARAERLRAAEATAAQRRFLLQESQVAKAEHARRAEAERNAGLASDNGQLLSRYRAEHGAHAALQREHKLLHNVIPVKTHQTDLARHEAAVRVAEVEGKLKEARVQLEAATRDQRHEGSHFEVLTGAYAQAERERAEAVAEGVALRAGAVVQAREGRRTEVMRQSLEAKWASLDTREKQHAADRDVAKSQVRALDGKYARAQEGAARTKARLDNAREQGRLAHEEAERDKLLLRAKVAAQKDTAMATAAFARESAQRVVAAEAKGQHTSEALARVTAQLADAKAALAKQSVAFHRMKEEHGVAKRTVAALLRQFAVLLGAGQERRAKANLGKARAAGLAAARDKSSFSLLGGSGGSGSGVGYSVAGGGESQAASLARLLQSVEGLPGPVTVNARGEVVVGGGRGAAATTSTGGLSVSTLDAATAGVGAEASLSADAGIGTSVSLDLPVTASGHTGYGGHGDSSLTAGAYGGEALPLEGDDDHGGGNRDGTTTNRGGGGRGGGGPHHVPSAHSGVGIGERGSGGISTGTGGHSVNASGEHAGATSGAARAGVVGLTADAVEGLFRELHRQQSVSAERLSEAVQLKQALSESRERLSHAEAAFHAEEAGRERADASRRELHRDNVRLTSQLHRARAVAASLEHQLRAVMGTTVTTVSIASDSDNGGGNGGNRDGSGNSGGGGVGDHIGARVSTVGGTINYDYRPDIEVSAALQRALAAPDLARDDDRSGRDGYSGTAPESDAGGYGGGAFDADAIADSIDVHDELYAPVRASGRGPASGTHGTHGTVSAYGHGVPAPAPAARGTGSRGRLTGNVKPRDRDRSDRAGPGLFPSLTGSVQGSGTVTVAGASGAGAARRSPRVEYSDPLHGGPVPALRVPVPATAEAVPGDMSGDSRDRHGQHDQPVGGLPGPLPPSMTPRGTAVAAAIAGHRQRPPATVTVAGSGSRPRPPNSVVVSARVGSGGYGRGPGSVSPRSGRSWGGPGAASSGADSHGRSHGSGSRDGTAIARPASEELTALARGMPESAAAAVASRRRRAAEHVSTTTTTGMVLAGPGTVARGVRASRLFRDDAQRSAGTVGQLDYPPPPAPGYGSSGGGGGSARRAAAAGAAPMRVAVPEPLRHFGAGAGAGEAEVPGERSPRK